MTQVNQFRICWRTNLPIRWRKEMLGRGWREGEGIWQNIPAAGFAYVDQLVMEAMHRPANTGLLIWAEYRWGGENGKETG